MNDDEISVVYLTMQDLISNRINENIDLYNYNITGANGFTHKIVDYNATTKTATIRMMATGGQDLNNKEINLSISSFLTGSNKFGKFDANVNLAEVSSDVNTIHLNMLQIPGGGGDNFDNLKEKRIVDILKPDETNIKLPNISFAYISNIGFIDDKLHVQVKWTKKETEKANIDDHGTFLLISDKKTIYPTNIEFGIDEDGNSKYGNGYSEYIFDVNKQMVSCYSLVAENFATNSNYIEGNWQVSFSVKAVNSSKKVDCDINIDGIKIKSVCLSPLGITLFIEGKKADDTDIEVTVPSIKNRNQNFSKFFDSNHNNQHIIKCVPIEPFDIENIDVIYVNGFPVNLFNELILSSVEVIGLLFKLTLEILTGKVI
ncbi:hypothetical protein [Acetivibrio cellulolyticus]|uniref:hypothetical protein n=1 Tax=Acetivibrio cellulolyticus TaxID=35830 RepID=UPI0001E2BD5D|nr:hypothetical protein [Acetivibrio cellulolyticus]